MSVLYSKFVSDAPETPQNCRYNNCFIVEHEGHVKGIYPSFD